MARQKPLTRAQLFAKIQQAVSWGDQLEGSYCSHEKEISELKRQLRTFRHLVDELVTIVRMPEVILRGIKATLQDISQLGSGVLTLDDWAKKLDPDGKLDDDEKSHLLELLSKTNDMLSDERWANGKHPPSGDVVNTCNGEPPKVAVLSKAERARRLAFEEGH